jgi:transposase-like protein
VVRHSLAFVSYKDRKAAALKPIYKAKDADAGKAELERQAAPGGQNQGPFSHRRERS